MPSRVRFLLFDSGGSLSHWNYEAVRYIEGTFAKWVKTAKVSVLIAEQLKLPRYQRVIAMWKSLRRVAPIGKLLVVRDGRRCIKQKKGLIVKTLCERGLWSPRRKKKKVPSSPPLQAASALLDDLIAAFPAQTAASAQRVYRTTLWGGGRH